LSGIDVIDALSEAAIKTLKRGGDGVPALA
jgi:hypothetical protein